MKKQDEDAGSVPSCQLCDGSGLRTNGVTGKKEPCPLCGKPYVPPKYEAPPPPKPKVPKKAKEPWVPKQYPSYKPRSTCGALKRCERCGGIHPGFECLILPPPAVATEPWMDAEWMARRRKSESEFEERKQYRLKHNKMLRQVGGIKTLAARIDKKMGWGFWSPEARKHYRRPKWDTDQFRADEFFWFGQRPGGFR